MKKWYFLLVVLACAPAYGQKVYKCVGTDGAVSFANKPCADKDSREEEVKIRSQATRKSQSTDNADLANEADGSNSADFAQTILGRWEWRGGTMNGSEIQTFHAGGRFQSRGKDDLSRSTADGTWTIEGKKLTISATYKNVFKDGSDISVQDTDRSTILSLDGMTMVRKTMDTVYIDAYQSEWKRR